MLRDRGGVVVVVWLLSSFACCQLAFNSNFMNIVLYMSTISVNREIEGLCGLLMGEAMYEVITEGCYGQKREQDRSHLVGKVKWREGVLRMW
jgi:hypothetical protein